MPNAPEYQSRTPDKTGRIAWSDNENAVWQALMARQKEVLPGRACQAYLDGLDLLNLPQDSVPQLPDVDKVLLSETGWKTAAVPALINFTDFFSLLANKSFPVATFIRSKNEFDYLQEPDIFHEVFGHCPLLTNPAFAHFTHTYGKLGLKASKEDRMYLARLYWFTVEFGLINTPQGIRIYGGGILSSPGETHHALENGNVLRMPLEPRDALRTPYRIDIMQPLYYVINSMETLYSLAEMDIMALVNDAKVLGDKTALFPPKKAV